MRETEDRMQETEVVRKRKRERRRAQALHPSRPMAWFGGQLYFTDTRDGNGRPVDRVPSTRELPKPGAKGSGIAAAFPPKRTDSGYTAPAPQTRWREPVRETEPYRDPWRMGRW